MNRKKTTNSQLSTMEPKKTKQKHAKQATRTGTKSQKWRSCGRLLAGKNEGKDTGNKKHKW